MPSLFVSYLFRRVLLWELSVNHFLVITQGEQCRALSCTVFTLQSFTTRSAYLQICFSDDVRRLAGEVVVRLGFTCTGYELWLLAASKACATHRYGNTRTSGSAETSVGRFQARRTLRQ